MSNLQRGRNGGITGLVDLPGASAKFNVRIYGWKPRLGIGKRDRRGRGSSYFAQIRRIMSTGTIGLVGALPPSGVPQPDIWRGETGTLTIQVMTGKTITYPIVVLEHGFDYDEKKQDFPSISIAAGVTGDPTYSAGWGTQPTAGSPSRSDQQQWDGTSFSIDANLLASAGQLTIDWWDGAVSDTSAAEITKLAAVIAAAVVPSPFKIKVPSIARDAPDGGTITIPLSLTTTAEDWINPRTAKKIDPNKIQTSGTAAALNATPTIPTISGQTVVERLTSTEIINDSVTGKITEYGQLNTQDDITYPGTHKDIDISDLNSTGISTQIFANGDSPPSATDFSASGVQPVKHFDIRINRDEWRAVYEYAKDTPKQSWEQEHSTITSDTNNLASEAEAAAVDDSTPTAPSLSNAVKRYQRILNITHDHTGYVDVYGLRDTIDDIEMDESEVNADLNAIDSTEKIAKVYTTTDGVPVDPSPTLSETKIVGHTIKKKNRIKSVAVFDADTRDSLEKRGFAKEHIEIDANHITDNAITWKEWTTADDAPAAVDNLPAVLGSVTANVKLITFDDIPLVKPGETTYLRWFLWGPKDSRDDLVLPNYETTTDASDIDSKAGRAYLDGDSVPSTPSGMVLRDTKVVPVTLGLGTNRTLTVLLFGKLTRKDEIEKLQSRSIAEPGNIAKEERVVKVLTTAPPVTDNTYNPDTTNLEFWTDEVHQITSAGTAQYVHVITYKPLSPLNEDQEEFKQIVDDPISNLVADDHRRITDANATTAAPSITNIAGASMVCVRRLTKKRGHTLYQHDFWYELRSVAAKIVAEKTTTTVDVSAIESEAFTAEVFLISGGAAGVGSAPFTNAQNINYRDFTVENPLYTLRVYGWALITNQQKIEYANTAITRNPLDLYKKSIATLDTIASTLSSSAYADSIYGADISDATFDSVSVKRKTPTKILTIQRYTGEDMKRHSGFSTSEPYPYRGKPTAGFDDVTAFAVATSYVLVNIPGPIILVGGYSSCIPQHTYWERKKHRFMVRRRWITTTARQPDDFYFPTQQGTVNSATFLRYAAKTVKYLGWRELYNGTENTNHLLVIDYEFEFDSQFHMNDLQLPVPGNRYRFYDSSVNLAAAGYIDPRLLFGPSSTLCSLLWPATSSFSSFAIT